MISWFRTKRVSISHHLPVSVRAAAGGASVGAGVDAAVRSREDLLTVIGCDCGSHGAAGGGGVTGSSGSVMGGIGVRIPRCRRQCRLRRRCDADLQRVVRVVQVVRIARRRNEFGVLVAPTGAQQQRLLQPRIGEVEGGEQVDVVTSGDAVGERRDRTGRPTPTAPRGSDPARRRPEHRASGPRFFRFSTRSSPASLTRPVAVSLN